MGVGGLVVTSWLQGTSRDGDPHDHIHNLFARIVHTDWTVNGARWIRWRCAISPGPGRAVRVYRGRR